MHIKICSRCHFSVAMKKRICQICGGDGFSEVAVAEEPTKNQMQNSNTAAGGGLKGIASTFWSDMQETAQKSKRASHQIAKIFLGNKTEDTQDASQR